ncbi:hypothetical protein ATANTOWER_006283, partial [Ataeniobius toweri]|nr:hypothetical protein [Ataeniobius toweri]
MGAYASRQTHSHVGNASRSPRCADGAQMNWWCHASLHTTSPLSPNPGKSEKLYLRVGPFTHE